MLTREEAFPELQAEADSDIEDWRDKSDFEPSTLEDSETGDSDEGSEQDLIEPDQQQQNTRGHCQKAVPCNREGRGRGLGNRVKQSSAAQEALLEAKCMNVDQEPQIPPFTSMPEIQGALPSDPRAGEFMTLFLDLLVMQTNLYAIQCKRNNPNLPRHSQAQSWFDTTRGEMKKFIALSPLMGFVRKPELSDYWSTNPLL